MKRFTSIEKLDTGILYILELASSISVLLLAAGLIASMSNVLTEGILLSDSIPMQIAYAISQSVAIDAGLGTTIIRTFKYYQDGEKIKTWLYGLLSVLLLFTAAIVSNIEAVQQALNISLQEAYIHVFIPIEVLIWVRSITVVLLIVAHAMRHVSSYTPAAPIQQPAPQPASLMLTPELLSELRMLLTQTTVSEEQAEIAQITETATATQPDGEQPEEPTTPSDSLFLTVSEEERNKVIAAYKSGIPRREICAYLKWGSSKYSTIVKPVLDRYDEQTVTREEQNS